MTLDLEAIEALANAATPGAWWKDYTPIVAGHLVLADEKTPRMLVGAGGPPLDGADAAFISASRTAIPELIAEVRKSQAEVAALREALEKIYERGEPMSAAIAQDAIRPSTIEFARAALAKVAK